MQRWGPFIDPNDPHMQPALDGSQSPGTALAAALSPLVPAHRVTMQIRPRGRPAHQAQAAELLVSMHSARASAPSQLAAEQPRTQMRACRAHMRPPKTSLPGPTASSSSGRTWG